MVNMDQSKSKAIILTIKMSILKKAFLVRSPKNKDSSSFYTDEWKLNVFLFRKTEQISGGKA